LLGLAARAGRALQGPERNPTYFGPEDWRELDGLVDRIIEENKAGYQMVNSVKRLEEMKIFVRMFSA
jgi:hypothetical protein